MIDNMSENHAKPHRVAVLWLPPLVGFDATIPSLVFGEATDDSGAALYEVTTCGLTTDPITTTTGYAMTPQAGPEALADADTVIVPGPREPSARERGELAPEIAAAFARIRPGTRMVSICTGAAVLAAAGVFDGRPATTHWRFAERFAGMYPDVHFDDSVLFVDDGDVLSSAGLAAGIDLCACTSFDATTAARWPIGWLATAWCRRGVRAVRRSSSNTTFPSTTPGVRRRRGSGRCAISMRHCRCRNSPDTRT